MPTFDSVRRSLALHYALPSVERARLAAGAPVSARDQLDRHLRDSGQHNYQFTTALGDVLEQYVEVLRESGGSSDAVIVAVDQALRVIQPSYRIPTDEAWKASWDAYFNLYDQLIQRAVFSYFVRAENQPSS